MNSTAAKNFSFQDMINLRQFELCYQSFSKFIDLPLAVCDPANPDRNKLYSKQFNPLCKMIAKVPSCRQTCLNLDAQQIKKAVSHEKGLHYKCHFDMVDIVIPIFVDGNHIATIICGQVLSEPHSENGLKMIWRKLSRFSLDKKNVTKAYYDTPYMSQEKIEAAMDMLYYFAQYFCQAAHDIKFASERNKNAEIEKAIRYIIQNYKQPLSLSEVADHVCLSKYHFSRTFKKNQEVTFTQYLRQIRMAHAKQLLIKNTMPISQVAEQSGFTSRKHFNKVFKETMNCSPDQFRRTNHLNQK